MATISDGTRSFELRLVDYEFPQSADKYDSNSLVASVHVNDGTGAWPPVEAWLTTHDVRNVIKWLRGRRREPVISAYFGDAILGFAIGASDDSELAVFLAPQYKSKPDPEPEEPFIYGIAVTPHDMARFADELETEAHQFPERRPRGIYIGNALIAQSPAQDARNVLYYLRQVLSVVSPIWLLWPVAAIPILIVSARNDGFLFDALTTVATLGGAVLFAADLARRRWELRLDRREVSLVGGFMVFGIVLLIGLPIGGLVMRAFGAE